MGLVLRRSKSDWSDWSLVSHSAGLSVRGTGQPHAPGGRLCTPGGFGLRLELGSSRLFEACARGSVYCLGATLRARLSFGFEFSSLLSWVAVEL